MSINVIQKEIKNAFSPEGAKASAWFFKTGEGQYGYGDIFLGLTVPQSRIIAKKYRGLSLSNIERLLHSKYHEERLVALLILAIERFEPSLKRKYMTGAA